MNTVSRSAKKSLLPSLLDRLTDDDRALQRVTEIDRALADLEQSMVELRQAEKKLASEDYESKKQKLDSRRSDLLTQSMLARNSIMSMDEIRSCVKRDLDWLFNSHQYSPLEELDDFPEVRKSVLNFGLPDMAGKTVSGSDVNMLEKLLKQVIIDFEPRILKRSLKVRINQEGSQSDHNALLFEIEGELWSQPVPLYLHLQTELQLDDGGMDIKAFSA